MNNNQNLILGVIASAMLLAAQTFWSAPAYADHKPGHASAASGGLAQEIQNRQAGDAALQAQIDAEEAARMAADEQLQSNINAEAAARQAADQALEDAIDTTALQAEIAELREAIIALEEWVFPPIFSATLEYENEAFDLETGTVFNCGIGPLSCPPEHDFLFAFNGSRANPTVLFQNQGSGVEIAFLDGVPFENVLPGIVTGLVFTTGLIDEPFDNDDTIVLRTPEGNVWKVGRPVNDLTNFTVSFLYQQLQ